MLFNFLINLFLSSIRINIAPYFVLQILGFTCRTSSRIHLQILFQPTLIRAIPNNGSAHQHVSNVNACFFRTMSELIFLLCALKKLHTHPIFYRSSQRLANLYSSFEVSRTDACKLIPSFLQSANDCKNN